MNRRYVLSAGIVCSLVLAGCASTTPNLDQHFGSSLKLIKAQQILNMQAAYNVNPVQGLDGMAAKSAYDAYQKSYKSAQPQSGSYVIGVGR
ncbi:MAG: outer membrane murein-binding lipoprotein Lpp [Janthinobacterium sp.]|jgi:outer membrane murein-binding lipoprotein Lpp